jgi:hypothetical protein
MHAGQCGKLWVQCSSPDAGWVVMQLMQGLAWIQRHAPHHATAAGQHDLKLMHGSAYRVVAGLHSATAAAGACHGMSWVACSGCVEWTLAGTGGSEAWPQLGTALAGA